MTLVAGSLLSLVIALALRVPGPVAGPVPGPGVWPLHPRPEVVSAFDPPSSTYGAGHRGVDLAGEVGQVVRAAVPGRVTFAGVIAGVGVVVVGHGATRTTYQPVRASVAVGAEVTAGDEVGRLERFGSHCAPRSCLHWGLVEGGTYLDPLTLVGAGPVRLLPLFTPYAAPPDAGRGWLSIPTPPTPVRPLPAASHGGLHHTPW